MSKANSERCNTTTKRQMTSLTKLSRTVEVVTLLIDKDANTKYPAKIKVQIQEGHLPIECSTKKKMIPTERGGIHVLGYLPELNCTEGREVNLEGVSTHYFILPPNVVKELFI